MSDLVTGLEDPDAPVVLLIMEVAAQLIHWPDAFAIRSSTTACKPSAPADNAH